MTDPIALILDPAASLQTLSFISGIPGNWEFLIILLIGLLLFGRRLPEVGRNIGKTVVEFRKGIKDIERDVETESSSHERSSLPSGEEPAMIEGDDRAVAQTGSRPSEA